jgi:hypothetical protein
LQKKARRNTHFTLSFHGFVKHLPFNQEHGYLLVQFHVHPHIVVSQGLAFTTTGAGCFAEPLRPSAKPLPSAALSKAPSAKIRSAKPSLPRAVYRALGKAYAARNKKCEKNLKKIF